MHQFKRIQIVHSDHGYRYASSQFKRLLKDNLVAQSMSHVRDSLHNHSIEYWFSIIRRVYKTTIFDQYDFWKYSSKIKHFIKY